MDTDGNTQENSKVTKSTLDSCHNYGIFTFPIKTPHILYFMKFLGPGEYEKNVFKSEMGLKAPYVVAKGLWGS